MWQYDLVIEKFCVTQSGYFRLTTTVPVALDVDITNGKLLLCHGISQESEDNTISTKDYNNRMAYDLYIYIYK